jgi:hypothetical protein
VESTLTALGIESIELLTKRGINNKKLLNPLKFSFLKNLKKIKSGGLLNRFESIISPNKDFFKSLNPTRRINKKEIINKNLSYLVRLKKIYLISNINLLGTYFSSLLSNLFDLF